MKKSLYLLLAVFFIAGGVGSQRIISRVRQRRAEKPVVQQEQICDEVCCDDDSHNMLAAANFPFFKKKPPLPKVRVPDNSGQKDAVRTLKQNTMYKLQVLIRNL